MQLRHFAEKITNYAHAHEGAFGTLFFVIGFLWDSLTLVRPDGLFENAVFWVYILITTVCIITLLIVEKKGQEKTLLLAITHFCLGSLAGGLIILYARSGTLQGSLIFFLIGAIFLLAHEFFKGRYKSHLLRISVWYSVLVMYTALTLPILYKRMDDSVFTHALITAFLISFIILLVLRITRLIAKENDFLLSVASTAVISAFFSIAYITHILPPVPLALKTAGIYHSVTKEKDNYLVKYEKSKIPFFADTSTDFLTNLPTKIYCFSSVYAPAALTTPIRHVWEIYVPEQEAWISLTDVPFSITGGRSEGYRGYSYISIHQKGRYRCSITTGNGTLIGRRYADVTEGKPSLTEKTY